MRTFKRTKRLRHGCVRAALLSLVGTFGLLSGCTTYQACEGDRARAFSAAPLPDDQWPARKMDGLADVAAATPHEIFTLVSDGTKPGAPVPASIEHAVDRPAATVVHSGVYGKGILREFEYPGGEDDPRVKTFGTLRFYSRSARSDCPADPRAAAAAERQVRSWEKRLAHLDSGLKPADPNVLRILSDGTGVRVIAPAPGVPVHGTIVYMSGLGSGKYEQSLIDELGRRGWWLVKVATPRVWWYESQPWFIGSRAEVPQVARKLAGVLDDLVAEPAYAAESALDYLAEHRPEIPQSPLVMVGCSAGALASPAVVARMPDRFDAAVLVGGGANLLEISQKSDLTDAGIKLAWPDNQPRGQWREELFREYLKYSKLDPYHTSRFLRNKPVLMLQANLDFTVPADNGWLLWQRLGCPDRYDHVGEHRTLFLTLGSQSNRIADWLDDQTARHPPRNALARASGSSRDVGGGVLSPPGLLNTRDGVIP